MAVGFICGCAHAADVYNIDAMDVSEFDIPSLACDSPNTSRLLGTSKVIFVGN